MMDCDGSLARFLIIKGCHVVIVMVLFFQWVLAHNEETTQFRDCCINYAGIPDHRYEIINPCMMICIGIGTVMFSSSGCTQSYNNDEGLLIRK